MEKKDPSSSAYMSDRPMTPIYEERDTVPDLPVSPTTPSRNRIMRRRVAPDELQEDDIADGASLYPPSFAQSEFETIVRRQRNNQPHMLKIPNVPSRFPNLSNNWEFAGWGSMSYVELTPDDISAAEARVNEKPFQLDQLRASSIAGNGIIGSVFYAFPAVAAVASIYSPITLASACIMLFIFRPILLELGSAVRLNGANYAYLLQFSGKAMGLVGAAATLLDAVATSSVSAATASAYLSGEFAALFVGLRQAALAIGFLVALAIIGLISLKESSSVTLAFTTIHLCTMLILMVASVVAWAKTGSHVLASNWALRPQGAAEVARSIFNGICISFLGVTGFETTPSYIENIKPSAYPAVLRNMLYTALVLNAPLMLLVYAILPSETILGGANVLSVLAETVAGKWLRILVVVDCMLVVGGGGVLAGLIGVSALIERLARKYATSNLLLKFNRDRLPRKYRTSLIATLLALVISIVVLVGNVVQTPQIIGLFLAYFIVILLCLFTLKSRIKLARIAMWIYDQATVLHKWKYTKGWNIAIIRWMRGLREQPIGVWVKSDDIYNLVEAILYIRRNESTARIIFIHAYDDASSIPSELEANSKILDEGFPSITIDLVFVKGRFNPTLVEATSVKLGIPKSQFFMSTMGKEHGWKVADYGGVRVVNL
ncbi:hypothetical protein FRC02_012152 [Tulasnella sp. 418]|nr:hypothetical protein FRC02_012152 [Tulasnella sp. 418]